MLSTLWAPCWTSTRLWKLKTRKRKRKNSWLQTQFNCTEKQGIMLKIIIIIEYAEQVMHKAVAENEVTDAQRVLEQ